jgi:hypothetical protein
MEGPRRQLVEFGGEANTRVRRMGGIINSRIADMIATIALSCIAVLLSNRASSSAKRLASSLVCSKNTPQPHERPHHLKVSRKVSLDLFVESFGRRAIEGRQMAVEKNILTSEDQNGFRNHIYAQRHGWIDPRCHHETFESDQLHCQPQQMSNQSQNTAGLPRNGCTASAV